MKKSLFKSFLLAGLFIAGGLSVSCSSSDDSEDTSTSSNTSMRVIVVVTDADGNALNVQDAKENVTKDYVVAGSGFQHRVLIEDFTGAWCGWCPRVSNSIEDLESTHNDGVVAVALHNGDKLAFNPYQSTLANSLWDGFGTPTNQRGYPFAVLNRSTEWSATNGDKMNKNQVVNLIKPSSPIGIKISSELGETSGKVDVSFKFNQSYTGLKYIVYVVQDGIILSQENYTNNYDGVKKIKDFKHNSVAKATNNIFGESVTNSSSGSEFTTGQINFTYKKF